MMGETVIALGNPFGIGLTVTTGVIGALDRTLRAQPLERSRRPFPDLGATRREEREEFHDFIQIDAAINPGNSGGPLLDVTGRWIGVNTAIWNRQTTTAEGIGFSIPVDRVRGLIGRAFKRRLLRGDWLGVEFEEADDGAARVRYAFPKGPALQGGLKEGDEITSTNGRPVESLFDLRWIMSFLPHGAAVELGVRREGRALPRPLTVRLLPVPTAGLSDEHLGFEAEDVSDEENRERELAFDAGVVVREVRKDGPAARIGMRAGDVVKALGSYRIRHSDDLLLFLQYVRPGDLVKVQILRAVRTRTGKILRETQSGQMVAE
jgi:serine protease Do